MKEMSQKQRQIANRLQHLVADQIAASRIRDLAGFTPVITATWMSKDYTTAKLFFSLLEKDMDVAEAEAVMAEFGQSIRKQVSRALGLKFVPTLKFYFDEHGIKASYVDGLIERVSKQDGEA